MLTVLINDRFLPEKTYALQVLLDTFLGLPIRIQTGPFEDYRLVLPNGNSMVVEDHFFKSISGDTYLKPGYLPQNTLETSDLHEQKLVLLYGRELFRLEQEGADATHQTLYRCGLDLFGSAFFMLSRWEEYVRPERDAHGRFPASAALARQRQFLLRPVVNEYAEALWTALQRLGWQAPRRERHFQIRPSHDVDHPRRWWSGAGRWRTLAASALKRRDWRETQFWLRQNERDPYDTFDELMDLSERAGTVSHFNFMGHRPPTSDAWYPLEHPFVRQLMQNINDRGHIIGFHPSYESFENPEIFIPERNSVQAQSPQPVETGRQHYLRFAAPHTWQQWNDAGMRWDGTLGYADAPGFRCGACYPFPVFNFLARQTLHLQEKPLIAMDVTLANYLQCTPETALNLLLQLRETVKKYEGEFSLLWHNSSWNTYFWADWRAVYREVILR